MTTSAQGNVLESFEASGLSIEEAERLASAFKPSWEFDEAPFTSGKGMDAAEMDRLAPGGGGGVNGDVRGRDSQRSQSAPPHAPPSRVETHEPEVSVIIDRSITANELAGHPAQPASPPAPVAHAVAAPAGRMVSPAASSRRPMARPDASESIEIPAAFKKSNKGLFIGVGAALAAALLVFVVRAATSDSDGATGTTPGSAAATATATSTTPAPAPTVDRNIPPPPPMPTAAAAAPSPPAQVAPAQPAPARAAPPAARPRPAPPPAQHERPRPAPRSPAKPPGGGIVRDVPF